MDDSDGNKVQSSLQFLIDTLSNPEEHVAPLLYPGKHKKQVDKTTKQLVATCDVLFKDIERLAKKHHSINQKKKSPNKKETNNADIPALAGLDELYIPESSRSGENIDVHTLWGQVDLQNEALIKMMKRSVKHLARSTDSIRLLDMNQVLSESEGEGEQKDADEVDDDDDDDDEASSKSEGDESDGDASNDEDEDEETRRIRERMERAVDDMDSGDDFDEDDDQSSEVDATADAEGAKEKSDDDEDLVDPDREGLRDGFFDLHEMEDFADEEEDYLPEDVFGAQQQEKKDSVSFENKKSFHQRQREGIADSGSDEEDEEDDELEDFRPVKRKKYREKEDIDALYTMYQAPRRETDDAIINMTAADLFGKPNKQIIETYDKKHKTKKPAKKSDKSGDDDDGDSWGEYDFEKEDQNIGWGASKADDDDDDNDNDNDDDARAESDPEADGMDQDDPAEDAGDSKLPKNSSEFAKRNRKLQDQTKAFEKEMLAEKPWQMVGESKGASRPVNSLLEQTPEFAVASKIAPTISVEQTADLEEVIKKRVLAEDWDDVVPRELPDIGWHKKRGERPEVSQEKSKLGLGELYEREYLKKAMDFDKDAAEKETEEDKAKSEMKALFTSLCSKLDALSNYHFAPRPIADEAEVRAVTTPAIAMEEVLPLHVSDARGVAPEEVYGAKRGREGVLRGDTEMDQTDRKRRRQSKKAARRKTRKEQHADEKLISRLQPGLGLNNPYEKRKMREELSEARARGKIVEGEEDANTKYGSSGTFFKRLQQETQEAIHGTSDAVNESKKKKSKPKSSAFKL